ncbi:MAG: HIT domain-containing protein [Caldisericia bacterium]|jgi:diadenosine tetraphosphate (Ap4A) HIT family hydrolase|nr:HIT domain-containing protein [Caldisericia bacterium]
MVNFCPFCEPEKERVIFDSKFSYALLDIFPVTKGHTLIIPKRHILKVEELNHDEILDIFISFKHVKYALEKLLKPDGFNFGLNLGEASGQSIMHLHFHLIPRYFGDTKFIDGGIRKVVMNFIDFEIKELKSKWVENRLSNYEIEKLKELINF